MLEPEPAESDYVVIGNPVAHSLSPAIHARFAAQTGERLTYGRLLVAPGGFAEAAERFFGDGGLGANVTVPFKADAAAWVTELAAPAELAGAVNTIVPAEDGFIGLNTDGAGLLRDLQRLLGDTLTRARVLVLGAGGAVRGIIGPLSGLGLESLTVANRTPAKAQALVQHFSERLPGARFLASPFDALSGPFDLVINGTAAGLDDAVPDLAPRLVRGAFCYDLVYGADTAFCRWAERAGAAGVADGIGMLVEQAALAFAAWRGKDPDTGPVLAELLRARGTGRQQ